MAVARSRASSGCPVTAPRNRLRDGPTSTGRPSACSASRDAVAQGSHAEQARARVLDAGLGRHGLLYAESVSYVENDRAIARQIDVSNTIARFGYDIKLRVITRIEAFYARPPLEDWE